MNKFCPNCGKEVAEGSQFCDNCGAPLNVQQAQVAPQGQPVQPGQPMQQAPVGTAQKSKLCAGLLGIFLGGLGIHNFYLGNTGKAVTQLLISTIGGIITCGIASVAVEIWGLVEGIMILSGSINTDANGVPLGQ